MTQPFRDAGTFAAALADMAEELRQALLGMRDDAERSNHLMKLVAESKMVFGVWPDPARADGVGIQIIKGEDIMPPLVGFETQQEVRIAAIPCVGRDVAVAAREAWGAFDARADGGEAQRTASEKLSVSEAERSRWASLRQATLPP